MTIQGREKAEMKEQDNTPIVYVALGDSTGVGVGAKAGGGYVARIFRRIEHERPGSRLINLCVSGATTNDVLRGQVNCINASPQSGAPTLVTLGIGINDVRRQLSADDFERNFETIITRIRQVTNRVIVTTNIPDISHAPVVPEFLRPPAQRRINELNERISRVVKRHGDVRVVDVYAPSHELIPQHPEFFSADGFHPSEVGYEFWAKMMWTTVKEAMEQESE